MVAANLQRILVEKIGEITKDIQTTAANGDTVLGTNGYCQNLPVVTENEEDYDQFFPYHIVRLMEGTTKEESDPWAVQVYILFGSYSEGKEHEGHFDVLEMCQRTVDHFTQWPLIANFRAEGDMSWMLQDEDTYPYYFGVVAIRFTVPKIERNEDETYEQKEKRNRWRYLPDE